MSCWALPGNVPRQYKLFIFCLCVPLACPCIFAKLHNRHLGSNLMGSFVLQVFWEKSCSGLVFLQSRRPLMRMRRSHRHHCLRIQGPRDHIRKRWMCIYIHIYPYIKYIETKKERQRDRDATAEEIEVEREETHRERERQRERESSLGRPTKRLTGKPALKERRKREEPT